MNFQEELNNRVNKIELMIRDYLPEEEGFAKTMAQAMNYSMCAGGKRLRPLLLQETYRLFADEEAMDCDQEGIADKHPDNAWENPKECLIRPFMAAIEMIHTHSLIHDDLPALDNDDYRRGRLTTHKVYGEAMGILSGVALLNYAYETMLRAFAAKPQDALSSSQQDALSMTSRTAFSAVSQDALSMASQHERIARAMTVMARKTGLYGMLGGQSVDVENDGKPLEKETLDYIYRHKTSALMEAPMMIGAILAGASDAQIRTVEAAAGKLGLAFQIQDDILDVTSTSQELGKPVHSDEKNKKVTYATLFGIEEASRMVSGLSEETLELLGGLGKRNRFLEELVRYLIHRKN